MRIVRLICRDNTKIIIEKGYLSDKNNIEILEPFSSEERDDYYPSTLKDVSIIIYEMMGQGVTWQLADELSTRLGINNPTKVLEILFDIFKEYDNLSDEEAWQKWNDSPKFYDP